MSESRQIARRTLLGAIMAVPAVIATGSVARALGVSQSLVGSAVAPSADDVGKAMASLRFGMFVHFNPSSVVGREIGWGRNASRPGEAPGNQYRGTETTDPIYDGAYRNFLPEADWATKLAATAKAAGMTYLVFTTKHHDGYPNFRADNISRSFYPDFADTPLGRSGRDLTREIADAARGAGLKLGFYYSPRDWTQPDYGRGDYATYYTYMMEHLRQLLTQYGKVDFLWYDSIPYVDRQSFRPPEMLTVPRELQPGILINDRAYTNMGFQNSMPQELTGDYSTPEGKVGAFDIVRPWESCISITPKMWSWVPGEPMSDFPAVLKNLASTAVGDGNYLLNVPPTKTGYLEDRVLSTLGQIGAWMGSNKQTIIGTRGGPYRAGDIGGATYTGSTIYLHITSELRPARLRLPALKATVKSITTLDGGRPVPFTTAALGDLLLDLSGFTKTASDFILQIAVDRPMSPEFVTDRPISWNMAEATVYEHTSYVGANGLLPLGSYTSAQLSALGVGFGISSMRVPRGYRVLGYPGDNFTGTPWTFTADAPDLGAGNDVIKSLKVTFDPAVDFRLVNVTDGLALDSGGNVTGGSDLKQWTPVDSPNLQWRAEDLGDGYYKLVNRTNGMVADGWGATGNGSPARQSAWNGSANQQWQITDRGNGRYSIANRTSGLVLDGGGQVPSGSVTKQWEWGSSTNLLWVFEQAS